MHWDRGQHSAPLSCDDGESDEFCIFLNWFVTKCFQDFCFGELVSLSEPSLLAELNEVADTRRFCGAFRLFVTGDCPEGDREPKWYFRCVFDGSGDGFSSLPISADAWTVSSAATLWGSAFWAPDSLNWMIRCGHQVDSREFSIKPTYGRRFHVAARNRPQATHPVCHVLLTLRLQE